MPVNASDFFNSASSSFEEKSEIGFRNCVSRSYYAMYHEVLSILNEEIPKYQGMGVHSCLLAYLEDRQSGEPYDKNKLSQLSYILRAQRDKRHDADYELDKTGIDSAVAENSMAAYKKISGICGDLLKQVA